MILYLHGFRSSPASHKAQLLREFMISRGQGGDFWCEPLPPAPREALALIDATIEAARRPVTLVGSSLGGLYATAAAEKHDCRAVLINPAVLAALTLEPYLGTQTNLYTGEPFELTRADLADLEALEAQPITPSRYWLLVEAGDEVLDYRAAVDRYQGARQTVLPGGDHSFTRFADYLADILAFAAQGARGV